MCLQITMCSNGVLTNIVVPFKISSLWEGLEL